MRVLMLDIDTLRPDHLGCYGYHRDTSPNIDRMAREGVRFDNYYCPDAPCLPSRAALFSGRLGIHTGAVGHGGTAADMRLNGSPRSFKDRHHFECLPTIFRNAGMKTASISPFGERHAAWWFYGGFNEMHNTGKSGGESAEEVTPTVLKWIEDNASDDNWFLHVNYWDPHTQYRAPEEFGNPFEDDPIPEWITEEVLEKHKKRVGPHSVNEINMYDSDERPHLPRHVPKIENMDDLRKHMDGYDCGIAYADKQAGIIFDALEKQGVMDDVIVIITSDHGENQGELGIYAEHGTSDNITHRIPMIVRWPGMKSGTVDAGLHYNLDLLPTLAELLDTKSFSAWDGESYASALRDGTECGRDDLVLSQCAHVCQRSVRFGPWLYMRTYHDGYWLFPQEMLFNIEEDPHEQNDLAAERPEICREAAHRLLAWHDRQMMKMSSECEVDPLWTVIKEGGPFHARGNLEKYCERLKATGRGWAVEELKKRHPREFE